jgi:hypothetical protein
LLLYAVGAGLFIAPIYAMSGLRDGVGEREDLVVTYFL